MDRCVAAALLKLLPRAAVARLVGFHAQPCRGGLYLCLRMTNARGADDFLTGNEAPATSLQRHICRVVVFEFDSRADANVDSANFAGALGQAEAGFVGLGERRREC